MKKYFLICSLLLAANFIVPVNAFSYFSSNGYNSQLNLKIPRPVLTTAELWACENGVLPESPPPDYVRAFYKQMSNSTWEVHWMWSKSGVLGEARLLITNGGTLLDVY